ncbi:MAG TPA: response regulator [Azospirillaceae bacterium]|nr:response regulator [Azospirillaceae bacterium]
MATPAERLLAHLPYLRRYARALTGSVIMGDELLTNAVEVALATPGDHGLGTRDSRLPLYRLLGTLFDTLPATAASTPAHPLEVTLAELGETTRRLFLLASLEELPVADAAAVVGLSPEDGHDRLAHARTAVAGRMAAHVLVVEDDAIIAFDLTETVRAMGHTVCGAAATMDQALELVRTQKPTLALLDVRLAQGGSGITIARHLRENHHIPVIFVTAFPEDLKSQGLNRLGSVVAKPFTRDQIERAITRAVFAVPDKPPPFQTGADSLKP